MMADIESVKVMRIVGEEVGRSEQAGKAPNLFSPELKRGSRSVNDEVVGYGT